MFGSISYAGGLPAAIVPDGRDKASDEALDERAAETSLLFLSDCHVAVPTL